MAFLSAHREMREKLNVASAGMLCLASTAFNTDASVFERSGLDQAPPPAQVQNVNRFETNPPAAFVRVDFASTSNTPITSNTNSLSGRLLDRKTVDQVWGILVDASVEPTAPGNLRKLNDIADWLGVPAERSARVVLGGDLRKPQLRIFDSKGTLMAFVKCCPAQQGSFDSPTLFGADFHHSGALCSTTGESLTRAINTNCNRLYVEQDRKPSRVDANLLAALGLDLSQYSLQKSVEGRQDRARERFSLSGVVQETKSRRVVCTFGATVFPDAGKTELKHLVYFSQCPKNEVD